jgi:Serine hydrolase (FSH1)
MEKLTEGLKEFAEFVCLDAPSLSKGDFGWWHAISDNNCANVPMAGAVRYVGWEATYEWIVNQFDMAGPFDGVFGFSQGAALASVLVGLRSVGTSEAEDTLLEFSFVILAGGFSVRDPTLSRAYGSVSSYDLPSLHLIGGSDLIVPPSISLAVAARFRNPVIVGHQNGHTIPGDAETRRLVAGFLEARQKELQ